jgi:hypothetical protein
VRWSKQSGLSKVHDDGLGLVLAQLVSVTS